MENKRVSLIVIIILLCVFLPLAVIGIINKDGKNMLEENPNHEFSYKGHLWFYDESDEFLSKYECLTKVCELSSSTIDDSMYNINYYKDGVIKQVPVIDGKYTFITDGELIYLYDVVHGSTLQSYKAIKNYNTKIANDTYILQNKDGLWGALSFGNGLDNPVKFEYDFVGLINNANSKGELLQEKYIVKKDSKWYLIDNENNSISGLFDNPIIDYTNDYIFSKTSNEIKIFSYENYEYLQNFKINDYILVDKYIGLITDTHLMIYSDLGGNRIKAYSLTNLNGNIKLELNNNKIDVKVNEELIESIEVN